MCIFLINNSFLLLLLWILDINRNKKNCTKSSTWPMTFHVQLILCLLFETRSLCNIPVTLCHYCLLKIKWHFRKWIFVLWLVLQNWLRTNINNIGRIICFFKNIAYFFIIKNTIFGKKMKCQGFLTWTFK